MKVAFYTLGCKVNQYETNAMIQQLIGAGYEITEYHQFADIYIINTCTVTNMSDKKSRQMLRRTHQINPKAIVIAVGCYAQVAKQELEKIKDIDLILGINEKNHIAEYIQQYLKEKNHIEQITDVMQQREFLDFGAVTYTEKTRAVIKIQDGCDRFCSYCIIPYARGRVRSRKIESIISEAREIVQKGIKEIVITGIHIASYGKDFQEDLTLINVLEKLNKIEGLRRIRLGSLEPTIITKEFVARLSKLEKICDHFHLSLQSGCNETLRRMNRRYTIEQFQDVVKLLRATYPNVALTTDIIVGFPGETEEEFAATYEYLKKIGFYKMHVFPYSPRSGTKAAEMSNQIENAIKEQRSRKLIELSNTNETEFLKNYIGKKVEVLFEQQSEEYAKGHTSNYIEVTVKANHLENTVKNVEISNVSGLTLVGQLSV